jgi:hypothetical protein
MLFYVTAVIAALGDLYLTAIAPVINIGYIILNILWICIPLSLVWICGTLPLLPTPPGVNVPPHGKVHAQWMSPAMTRT